MRPGGKNSPLNKDLTPKNFKMPGEFPGTPDQFDKKYKLGKYKNQKNIFQKIGGKIGDFFNKPIIKDYPTQQQYQDAVKSGTSNQYNSYEPEGELTEKVGLITKGLSKVSRVSKLGPKLAVAAGGVGVGIGAGKLVTDIVTSTTPTQSTNNQQSTAPKVGIKTAMEGFSDWRQELDEKCWPGYEKKGMKTMFGKRYPNCVKKSKKKK